MPSPRRRFTSLPNCLRSKSWRRFCLDGAGLLAFTLIVRAATYNQNLFERFSDFSRAHEDWQLDEALITVAIVGLALIAFCVRRLLDVRRELAMRVAAEERAALLAHHDSVTGLPNLRRFRELVTSMAVGDARLQGIALIDIQEVSYLDDALGTEAGDEVMRAIAQRLDLATKGFGTAARVGNRDFALLVKGLDAPAKALDIAESAVAALRHPLDFGGQTLRLEVVCGVAVLDDPTLPGESYIRQASAALRQARRRHEMRCVRYRPGMEIERTERLSLELHRGLKAGEVVPYFQPIVELQSGRIVKLEALARWLHPSEGIILPIRFISVAEDRGMIRDLTETILRQACIHALDWPASVKLSVNLSPVLLGDPTFPLRIVSILAETGLAPRRLELEITECALEADIDAVQPFLGRLRALGVKIALDDFGTGYSSLARLQDLQFDDLKIDRSFIQGMARIESGTIVESIIRLGRGLGMTLTAEGVETAEEHTWLLGHGCQHGQGDRFGRPMPANAVVPLFAPTAIIAGRRERRVA